MPVDASAASRPHVDRSVLALLASVFCWDAALMAQTTVLGKLVYDMTGSVFDLGLLGLVEFAPAALLVLVTGAVADHFDRRRIVAAAHVVEMAVAAVLAWYSGTRPTAVLPIFLLVIGFGSAKAFGAPASRSLPADMVSPDRLPWLVARDSSAWQAAIIVGPVLGGFLYTVDVRLPFIAVTVLLALAGLSVLVIRIPPAGDQGSRRPRREESGGEVDLAALAASATQEAAVEPSIGHGAAAEPARGGLHDALEGLRFVRGHSILLGAISLDLFAVLFGGAVALLPAIAKDRLGVGAVGLGWLRAAGGIGAAAMTITLAIRPIIRRVGPTLLVAVALFGVGTIVLGVTTTFAVAFAAMLVLSAADSVSVFIRSTLVPLITPNEKRGRVLAVENVFIGASNELGAFESGVAGQLIGTSGSVVLGGAATLAVAFAWWVLFPSLRRVDRFPSGGH